MQSAPAGHQIFEGKSSLSTHQILNSPVICHAISLPVVKPYLQVRGLEFNAGAPNLLASGAEDGELCIWDLASPATPSLYPALKVRTARQHSKLLLELGGASHHGIFHSPR